MRFQLLTSALLLLPCTTPAFAVGVPVADAQRLDDMTGIANCMAKVDAFRSATVALTGGIHTSMADPGSARSIEQSGSIGKVNVVGPRMQTGSRGNTTTGSNVGGLDLSPLFKDQIGIGAVQGAQYTQVLGALQAVSKAVPANTAAFQAIGGAIGRVNGVQGAWEQNSSGRIGSANVWNQALQIASTMADLRNQILMWQTSVASSQARTMSYDRSKASFVSKAPAVDNQSQTSSQTTTLSTILYELQGVQDAAQKSIANSGVPSANQ